MGIFSRRKSDKNASVNYIIKEYYGGNSSLFIYRYAQSIYSIPEVRTAIETFADIFATVPVYHKIVYKNGETKYIDDDIINVLAMKANPLQNSIQFWKSVITQLMLQSNIFIEPVYDIKTGKLASIYPLPNQYYEFVLENNVAYVRFLDKPNGDILEKHDLEDLIYLNRFSSLTGGEKTNLGLYQTVIQALSNYILKITDPKKVKAILKGRLGAISNLKEPDKKGTMNDLKASFDQNVEGIAYVDPQWDITPVNWNENDVNRDLMKFVINVVYNYFKISDSIINNTSTELEREMFISNAIKPLAKQIEQEFTYKLFTEEEIRLGHRIELDTFALSVSTLSAKNGLFATASRNGIMNIDEMREYIGQPLLPNGLGQKYRGSADCVDLSIIDDYQMKKVSTGKTDDIKNQKKEGIDGTSSNS